MMHGLANPNFFFFYLSVLLSEDTTTQSFPSLC